jgi:hypothetical protein
MALPQIAPLSSEFDMPNKQAKDAVKQEITKLGAVIIEKTSASLKSATQSVIGDVPKMISDLTKEIESGPIDNFAVAINKLVKLVDDLGINLNDYDRNLAKLVDNFRSEQQDAEQKLEKLREQGFRGVVENNKIRLLTEREVIKLTKERKDNEIKIQEKIADRDKLQQKLDDNVFKESQKRTDAQEKIIKNENEISELREENEKIDKTVGSQTTAGRDQFDGFSKLTELKEAFMVIPDTITEVFDTFKAVGTKVFSGFTKLFTEPGKALKEMGKNLTAVGGVFKTARILLALKIAAVVAAIQFFAERIDKIGDFFVGIWDKITGFFQGIVDWFKNSTFGKLLGLGKGDDEKAKPAAAGTAGDMAGETYMEDDNFFKTPVRSPSSATIEDGLENQTITEMGDYNDDSQKFLNQRQMADMDGLGTEEIDYSGIRGGTSLSQLGIKKRQVVGNQLQTDDGMGMYGNVSESLKELNAQNTAESAKVINIQNNSNVNSQSSSGTTVSGFVDHEPDTSFKYVRQSATGSMEF